MNCKTLIVLALVAGCAMAIPMEDKMKDKKDNSTAKLESDKLMATDEEPKKLSTRELAELLNKTGPAAALSKNETDLPPPPVPPLIHPKLKAAMEEKKMNMTMKPKESMSMSTSTKRSAEPEMKDDMKPKTEAKKSTKEEKDNKLDTVVIDEKDLMPEPDPFEPTALVTSSNATLPPGSLFNSSHIPEQNDTALMEAIMHHGLLDKDAKKDVTLRDAAKKDCNDTTHAHEKPAEDAKPASNVTATKKESTTAKPMDKKAPVRRRRDAYASHAPSQVRHAGKRQRPAARASYEAPAEKSAAYEAPAAAPAVKSSYEAPAAPAVRSSYKKAVRTPAPTYEAPAVKSTYEAPAAPVRSSYKEVKAAKAAAPAYETPAAPAVKSTYEAPAAAPVRASYSEAKAAKAAASYEAPAAPEVKSTYEAPAAPAVRSSYKKAVRTPAPTYEAPAVKSTYEAPAPAAPVRSYTAPVRARPVLKAASYDAPAPVVKAADSGY